MKKYKLYFHLNAQTFQVFYVGIGIRSRHTYTTHRSIVWANYVNKYGFIPVVIERFSTCEEAREREMFYIKKFGRIDNGTGILVNLTDGGEGAFGAIRSAEIRERMSIAARSRKKIKLTEEHKANISKALSGKKHSESHKQKNSLSKKEAYAKNPNMGMRGKPVSEETRRKIGESNKIAVKKYWQSKRVA